MAYIVEQHADNLAKFPNQIHTEKNMVLIPWGYTWSLHGKISGYYGSIDEVFNERNWYAYNTLVRTIVKEWDFAKQKEFWLGEIKRFKWESYLKLINK